MGVREVEKHRSHVSIPGEFLGQHLLWSTPSHCHSCIGVAKGCPCSLNAGLEFSDLHTFLQSTQVIISIITILITGNQTKEHLPQQHNHPKASSPATKEAPPPLNSCAASQRQCAGCAPVPCAGPHTHGWPPPPSSAAGQSSGPPTEGSPYVH